MGNYPRRVENPALTEGCPLKGQFRAVMLDISSLQRSLNPYPAGTLARIVGFTQLALTLSVQGEITPHRQEQDQQGDTHL
ncbi:MAG: hypothetical protein AAGI45_19355 [Cyanobacteria bacterium P01_H01_bin.26]